MLRRGSLVRFSLISKKNADTTSTLPHTIPKPIPYEKSMEALGLTHKDHCVLYDRSGKYIASARLWWIMKTYGHDIVSILSGGLEAWEKAKGEIQTGPPPDTKPRGRYKSYFKRDLIVDARTVHQMSEGRGQIIDARSPGRFNGTEPEPRPNVKGGNIPGSINIPYADILVPLNGGPEMTFPSPEELQELFKKKGLKLEERIATTCGSGISAAVLALGLHLADSKKWALYDGSWAEYGRVTKPMSQQ